jgi:hypothetical protein
VHNLWSTTPIRIKPELQRLCTYRCISWHHPPLRVDLHTKLTCIPMHDWWRAEGSKKEGLTWYGDVMSGNQEVLIPLGPLSRGASPFRQLPIHSVWPHGVGRSWRNGELWHFVFIVLPRGYLFILNDYQLHTCWTNILLVTQWTRNAREMSTPVKSKNRVGTLKEQTQRYRSRAR